MFSIGVSTRAGASAIALATLLAGTAGGAIAAGSTAGGTALARRALLRRADLGRGWSAEPSPKAVPRLTCPGFSPAFSGAVQTGAAVSPTFQQSQSGPFVSQTAYAYANTAEEEVVWRALARPRLLTCVAASLVQSTADGVHFLVTGKHVITLPSLPVRAAGYRVTGTASVPGQTVNVYLEVLLLGGGQTVTELSFSSFFAPVARAFELRLATVAARRL